MPVRGILHSRQSCGYFRDFEAYCSARMSRGGLRCCLTTVWRVRWLQLDFRCFLYFFIPMKKSTHVEKSAPNAVKKIIQKMTVLDQLFPFFSGNIDLLNDTSWLIFVLAAANFLNFTNYASTSRNLYRATLHSSSSFFEVSEIGRLTIDKTRVSTIKTNTMLPIVRVWASSTISIDVEWARKLQPSSPWSFHFSRKTIDGTAFYVWAPFNVRE